MTDRKIISKGQYAMMMKWDDLPDAPRTDDWPSFLLWIDQFRRTHYPESLEYKKPKHTDEEYEELKLEWHHLNKIAVGYEARIKELEVEHDQRVGKVVELQARIKELEDALRRATEDANRGGQR